MVWDHFISIRTIFCSVTSVLLSQYNPNHFKFQSMIHNCKTILSVLLHFFCWFRNVFDFYSTNQSLMFLIFNFILALYYHSNFSCSVLQAHSSRHIAGVRHLSEVFSCSFLQFFCMKIWRPNRNRKYRTAFEKRSKATELAWNHIKDILSHSALLHYLLWV